MLRARPPGDIRAAVHPRGLGAKTKKLLWFVRVSGDVLSVDGAGGIPLIESFC